MLNLDTHILLDFARGMLTPAEKKCIEQHQDELVISDIVLWEIAKLHSKKRIEIDLQSPRLKKLISFLTIISISSEIAAMSTELDFVSDPADEIIAATSVILQMPLLTRDERILKSKMIQFS
jgi:PIN domain nuclease of toxin-antitoxin system